VTATALNRWHCVALLRHLMGRSPVHLCLFTKHLNAAFSLPLLRISRLSITRPLDVLHRLLSPACPSSTISLAWLLSLALHLPPSLPALPPACLTSGSASGARKLSIGSLSFSISILIHPIYRWRALPSLPPPALLEGGEPAALAGMALAILRSVVVLPSLTSLFAVCSACLLAHFPPTAGLLPSIILPSHSPPLSSRTLFSRTS